MVVPRPCFLVPQTCKQGKSTVWWLISTVSSVPMPLSPSASGVTTIRLSIPSVLNLPLLLSTKMLPGRSIAFPLMGGISILEKWHPLKPMWTGFLSNPRLMYGKSVHRRGFSSCIRVHFMTSWGIPWCIMVTIYKIVTDLVI